MGEPRGAGRTTKRKGIEIGNNMKDNFNDLSTNEERRKLRREELLNNKKPTKVTEKIPPSITKLANALWLRKDVYLEPHKS